MTTPTTIDDTPRREPARSRAVFSTEDFRLMRAAVVAHLQRPDVQASPESVKYSNLYHRLGRLG